MSLEYQSMSRQNFAILTIYKKSSILIVEKVQKQLKYSSSNFHTELQRVIIQYF